MAKSSKSKSGKTPEVSKHSNKFMMGRNNYILVIVGLLCLAIGFLLMAGGGSDDPNVFNKEGIYSPRRITFSVIVIMIGFAIQVVAIMRKPKSDSI